MEKKTYKIKMLYFFLSRKVYLLWRMKKFTLFSLSFLPLYVGGVIWAEKIELLRLPLMKRKNSSCFYKSTLIFLFLSRGKSYESNGSTRNNDVFRNRQQREVKCRLGLGFAFFEMWCVLWWWNWTFIQTTNYFIDIIYFCW